MRYVTRLPILYIYTVFYLDTKPFNSVSSEDRQHVRDVMGRITGEISAENRAANQAAYDVLLAQGVQEVAPSKAELAEWRATAQESIKGILAKGEISMEIHQLLETRLTEVRGPGSSE